MEKLNNDEIKRKLSQTTVNMDLDAEWGEIASMLDKEEKTRKPFFWIFGLLTAFALVALGWTIFESEDKTVQEFTSNEQFLEQYAKVTAVENYKLTFEEESKNRSKDEGNNRLQSKDVISDNSLALEQKFDNKLPHQSTTSSNSQNPNRKTENNFVNGQSALTNTALEFLSKKSNPQEIAKENTVTVNTLSHRSSLERLLILKSALKRLPLKDRLRRDIPVAAIDVKKPQRSITNSIFIGSEFSSVSQRMASSMDNDYQNLLADSYAVLSRLSATGGYERHFSEDLHLSLGVRYNQFRSVFRGVVVGDPQVDVIVRDSAQVYVNNLGGDFYTPGEVTVVNTERSDIQQYSYTHSLGLALGAKYYFMGPIYGGVDLSWSPIQWQSGMMVGPDKTLQELSNLTSSINTLAVNLNLGVTTHLTEKVQLDVGLSYRPQQQMYKVGGVQTSTTTMGGNVRLLYNM